MVALKYLSFCGGKGAKELSICYKEGRKLPSWTCLRSGPENFFYGRGIVVEIWLIHSIAHNSGTMNI